ncbi:hypothetical protein MACK_001744 [Theileria orientalis]|uniref:Uncharacterized protein n=1 Tax=Theileria orientalis TaxID=68886 RepID=A0A976QXD4_THEOR|nr:hypothetical protein MACK_001744 [Theileria orientalis]
MADTGVVIKFKKLNELYSITINTSADLLVLADKILNDSNTIVGALKDIKEGDIPLENDFLKLMDILRNENESKSLKMSKKLVYMVVSECISNNDVELWKILISRMYLRGIREILVQAFIRYLSNVVKEGEEEEYKELCVLSSSETTRGICYKVLKYLAKFLYIEKVNKEYIVCIDNHKYYNMIRRTISIMTASIAKGTNTPIGYGVFSMFHPYNQANVPCLIKFMVIDVFTDEVKMSLLLYLAFIYADRKLMRSVHVNLLAYLAACMSRILHYAKMPPNFSPMDLSRLLTKGITENLQTLDPMRRLTAMTVAEAYSVFLSKNSTSNDEPMLLTFRKKYKVITPIMMYLGSHKSKVIINPNFAKLKKDSEVQEQGEGARENSDSTINQEGNEIGRDSSNEVQTELDTHNKNEGECEREKSGQGEGDNEDKGFSESKRIAEDDNEGEEDIESYDESEGEYRDEEETQDREEEENMSKKYKEEKGQKEKEGENKAFLDFIFEGVPSIKAKTVDGRVKETWLKPPQHIVQCYERLLSKPARGDVDYECINENGLDRLEDETVENKILRVSQTLMWLPKVISKKETILDKYAVPLSSVLLKLEDLDMYKEKIEEMAGAYSSKVLESVSEREIVEVVSKDPEELIMVSLVMMSFYSPYEVLEHYTEHLFDREITLASRLKMMLCIQYTLMGYLEQMDGEELTKKVLQRSMKFNVENEKGVKRLETGMESKVEGKIEVKLSEGTNKGREVKEKRKEKWRPSKTMTQKYLETMIMCLLNSLKIYKKKREGGEDTTDEEVAATIVQTIAILITINEKGSVNIGEIGEMIEYFSKIEGGVDKRINGNNLKVKMKKVSYGPSILRSKQERKRRK